MQTVMITGAGSYIGNAVERELLQQEKYKVVVVDMLEKKPEDIDFKNVDCVFHVAGIVHKKEKKVDSALYYSVNRDLAIKTALEAKNAGVKQFVLLSTMSVYGKVTGEINRTDSPCPNNHYGKSKYQADKKIQLLNDDKFSVCIVRPPMVYGKGCKGNYQMMRKIATLIPVFPMVNNKRSMIHIDNLSRFIVSLINERKSGLFLPQDCNYVCTSTMVNYIAKENGKKMFLVKGFDVILKKIPISILKKVFGDLVYTDQKDRCSYVKDLETAVRRTEHSTSDNRSRDKKKILFVATVVRMHINVFHLPYLKKFQDKGWETWVAAKNDFENREECVIPYCDHFCEIPFERSPFKLANLKAYKQLKNLINREQFDVVYCHTPVGAMIGRLASIDMRKHGTKVVYMAHGFHFFKGAPLKNWLLYYPAEYILSYFTDILFTINKEDYKISKKFKALEKFYIPGVGIDLNKFAPDKELANNLRMKNGIPEDAFVLMSVGELSKRKNHTVIIDAMARLHNKNIYYVICGCGELENNLIAQAQKYGLENQVKLLGFRKNVKNLYNMADVFVFPSLHEGLPVAVMEAMAMELPVIVSNVRGSADLITNECGGYVCEENTGAAFAEKISMIMNNDYKSYGKYNRMAVKKYSVASIVKKVDEIISTAYAVEDTI